MVIIILTTILTTLRGTAIPIITATLAISCGKSSGEIIIHPAAAQKTTLLPLDPFEPSVQLNVNPVVPTAEKVTLVKWPLLTSPQGEAIITAFRLLNILFIAFNS